MEEFQRLPRFPRKMVLYSSTNFRILKPWTIISNLIRFDLGFWQASKQIYRKLKYRENNLEEFQRLPRFPRKMVLYSSTNFCILKPWAIISNLIRFHLGFWQGSKPFCRKFIYREKVLEEFQRLPRFPRKIVLYLSSNFCILKHSAIISNLIIFDLDFWQASKPFFRKLKYKEKVLEKFQRLPRFPRNIVLYWPTNFWILKSGAIISNFVRFDLGFWLASKLFYRKLKEKQKVFEEFQRLPRFSRKMVLYSWTYFLHFKALSHYFQPYNIGFGLLRRFKKPFYRKLKYKEKVLEEFQHLPSFPREMVFYSSINLRILKLWAIICNFIRFGLGFWKASKPFYRKRIYNEKVLENFQRLPRFSRKIVLYSSTNFRILKPWTIFSNFIRFDLGFWQS